MLNAVNLALLQVVYRDSPGWLEAIAPYDELDNLTVRSAAGPITTYATDPLGRFTATANAASVDTIYYDVHGRDSLAVTVRGGNAYRRLLKYDGRGRQTLQKLTTSAWTDSIISSYENDYDRLTSISSAAGNIQFAYDGLGQLTSTTYPTTPSATTISQTFSSIGARASLSPAATSVQSLQRFYVQDENGRAVERWSPGALLARTTGYFRGRVTGQADVELVEPTCDSDQHYGNQCYDNYFTTPPKINDSEWQWDRVGNPTQVTLFTDYNHRYTSATVQTGNRLTAIWDDTLTYDDDGNLTSRSDTTQTRLFTWNALGQLDSVEVGAQLTTYGYDGWGRRVSKTVDGVRTNFIWDGDQVVAESNAAHTITARYGFTGSRPIWLRRGTDTRFYVQENAGSVRGLFNVAKQVTHSYDYWAFGERLGADTTETSFHNPLRFAGQYFDAETGMYYMRARYYDPVIYRFISEDPIGIAGGINPYEYAGGDPVNKSDPSGLDACYNTYETSASTDGASVTSTRRCPFEWFDGWLDGIGVGLYDMECPSDGDCINPLKLGIGAANIVRGAVGTATGIVILTAGTATAPVIGPISAPAVAVGGAKVAFGVANINRGAGQISEGLSSSYRASPKNVLGLLPFGQMYDDPAEPGPLGFATQRYRQFVANPATTVRQLAGEFFALRRRH